MKKLGYYFFKLWISAGLFCYYRKVQVKGLENVPTDKPVLFLSNHQNALMDVLLIATRCKRKPWFLTRSDVFANPFLKSLFGFLQMLPIYRIRDGKDNLSKNQAIFDHCGRLMAQNEAILIFPEANHSLKRRVRPLSKGFTRIIDNALQQTPNLDLQLVPVGQNYITPTQAGDSATPHFGKPISVPRSIGVDGDNSVLQLRTAVFEQLMQLTTHIEDEENYESILDQLNAVDADFLNPEAVNSVVQNKSFSTNKDVPRISVVLSKVFFYLLNLPMVVLWRLLVKPKVPEPEFMATFRFGFSLLGYPIFYVGLFLVLHYAFDMTTAFMVVSGHIILNLVLVKVVGITSSVQKR